MPAGFREKISCALTGILTHPTRQVSACTRLWTLGTRMLCYIAGFAPIKYPSSGISTMPAVPKTSWEMTFIDIRQVSIPTYITK